MTGGKHLYNNNNKVIVIIELSKLTTSQKQQLKDLVIDATVRRMTSLEMANYIQDKMQITISQDYLNHVKSSIRKDTKQTFTNLRKDIDLYINSIFFDRVDELRYMQKILHEVIETNTDNGEIQIKAVAQLQNITNQLCGYYMQLPSVAKVGVMDVNTLFPSSSFTSNNSNNSNNNNNNASWWCSSCNLRHKDQFGHHCPQMKVGLECENQPGYFGGKPDPERQF